MLPDHAAADILTDGEVLVADANTGWRVDDAARVVNAVRERDVYIEQPCRTYEHCLAIRKRTALPFILDENIDGIAALLRGHQDGAMDVINLKISKVGGLTRARQIRDLCVSLNIPMTIEDSWGGDIITAAIAHLAHSTPESMRFSATDFNSYVSVQNATGAPQRVAGHCGFLRRTSIATSACKMRPARRRGLPGTWWLRRSRGWGSLQIWMRLARPNRSTSDKPTKYYVTLSLSCSGLRGVRPR
jgi:hypothetical protein